ncbi:MAG: FkbM family methyltransferase [Bacteroidales bacterium]|jgi:predicted RNA methylase
MNKFLFPIYRILVPKPLRTVILKKRLRNKILKHFASLPENEINDEQKEVLQYLENDKVKIFPYPFHDNYSSEKIEVIYDREKGMRYVLQEGKRLYFKRRWNEKRIKRAYCDLMREQDTCSPHRYLTDSFSIGKDDILADIGAAEGNFSLAVIEKVRKIYLFEYDHEWTEALRATFAPWSEKVEIINKYISDHNDSSHIRFDTFFEKKKDITFLKIDVDGAESVVLNSCNEVFNGLESFKIAICTYHKNNDEKDFTALLKGYGFRITTSRGYMINYYDKKLKAPYLRRGLIRAIR